MPGAPEKLAVKETSKSSVTLTWAAPSSDGGSPVTGYHVERRLADSTRWIRVGRPAETSYTDTEVVEDTQYVYRVAAENKVGVGPPSEPTPPVTAKDPWSKPPLISPPPVSTCLRLGTHYPCSRPVNTGVQHLRHFRRTFVFADRVHGSWLRGPAVENWYLADVLSLSCARLVTDG